MQTRKAPDFWGLHKNMNGAFPLKSPNLPFQTLIKEIDVTTIKDVSNLSRLKKMNRGHYT